VLAGWPLDFWPVVVLQAAAAIWVLSLVLRVHGLGDRRLALFGTVALLAIATSLPWLADVLITDIFAGISVLALHLILFAPDSLRRSERICSMLFVAFAASTHSATFAVLLAIVACAALVRLVWRDAVVALWRGAGAVALGALMLLTANFALSGNFAWTPGGYGLVFARMLQDGIVARYLDEHCAERALKLCPYRHALPRDADEIHLVGHSFGACVAMKTAARLDGRIAKLVLLEANPFSLLAQARRDEAFAEAIALCNCVKTFGARGEWAAAAERFADYWGGAGSWRAMPAGRRAAFADAIKPNVFEWDAVLAEATSVEQWGAQLPADTLAIYDPHTVLPVREIAAILRWSCRSWTYQEVPGTGHMAPLTHPEVINPLVGSFLRA